MIANENILRALHRSTLIAELGESEIEVLRGLLTVRRYRAGEFIAKPGACVLQDALLILVEGDIDVSAVVDGEPMLLRLTEPGDLARIISFAGSNMVRIDATIEAKQDCAVLLLARDALESLLDTHSRIVYRVMRSLVRYTHGLARHKSAETEEMSNYFYGMNGRF